MSAELHSAFAWDCDGCGRENFTRAIEADLAEPAADAIADEQISLHFSTNEATETERGHGSPSLVTHVAIAPRHVTCRDCGQVYETEIAHQMEDGE